MTYIHADHFVRKDVYNIDYECNICKATLTEKGVKFWVRYTKLYVMEYGHKVNAGMD